MFLPTISVILPVYNSAKYLSQAIDSVLNQTFTDFELLIINDGSTDNIEEVIYSYMDSRIIYLKNESNRGLIYTLNRGLEEAKGEYIARMDGDDISLPERFQQQINHLKSNKFIDVVASQINLIDENGKLIGFWKDDIKHSDIQAIKSYLPVNNCIAHPTIIAKRSFLLKYKYDANQKLSEDYDLWLRIVSNGGIIDKLPLPLLNHRILPTSFTRTRRVNVFHKILIVKWIFIKKQLARGKFNKFIFLTFVYCFLDAIKVIFKLTKINIYNLKRVILHSYK